MTKPKAFVFDVDGTLCDTGSVIHHLVGVPKGKKRFDLFHEEASNCPPHPHVLSINHSLAPEVVKIVVTARRAEWYQHTLWWLMLNKVEFDHLFMRGWSDYRPDYEIKGEIVDRIEERYEIVYALDDNPNVCRLWEERGVPHTRVPGYRE